MNVVVTPSEENNVTPKVALKDLLALTKPRLSSLVLMTTGVGIWLAPGSMSWKQVTATLLATMGVVGSANALNCFLERESDARMERTASRPLPAGRMVAEHAFIFGVALLFLSVPCLAWASNFLTAALAVIAWGSYVGLYTPLKARSDWAMWVGALPGALPPLMGWTAVTGRLDVSGWILFGILFLWQIPHFLAIALFRKEEYRRANLISVPLVRGDESARLQATVLCLGLIPLGLAPYFLGMAGLVYALIALVLGSAFAGMAIWGWVKKKDAKWAKQFFLVSLLHLTGLLLGLILNGGPRGP